MAYTKTVHADRAVQFPNRYKDQNNVQYTFTPDPGTITQTGTAENAAVFNKLEQGVSDAHDAIDKNNWKPSVRVATTANIALSGTQTIDGIAVVAGDRVLVKNQTTGSQNGLYVVASGAWSRSVDADTSAEVTSGLTVQVNQGTVNLGTIWTITTANPITLGTTSLTFNGQPSLRFSNGYVEWNNGGVWTPVGGITTAKQLSFTGASAATNYNILNVTGPGKLNQLKAQIGGGYSVTYTIVLDGVTYSTGTAALTSGASSTLDMYGVMSSGGTATNNLCNLTFKTSLSITVSSTVANTVYNAQYDLT